MLQGDLTDKSRAKEAIATALPAIREAMDAGVTEGRDGLSIVVCRFGQPWGRLTYSNNNFTEAFDAFNKNILATEQVGDKKQWEHDFEFIATQKAFISWRTGLPTRVVQTQRQDLLWPSDIKFWGSAVAGSYVAACSGVQPWFDELFSQFIAGHCAAENESLVERLRGEEGTFFPR